MRVQFIKTLLFTSLIGITFYTVHLTVPKTLGALKATYSKSEKGYKKTSTTGKIDYGEEQNRIVQTKPKLLFSSGFEGIQLSEQVEDYQYLTGTDKETGFSWPPQLLGSEFSGIHRINDDNGKAISNKIVNTIGPHGNLTPVLFQQVTYDVQVTQTPLQINNIQENPTELYMSYWMKTDSASFNKKDTWRAIWEYKTKNYASYKNGFRMIAFMATDYEGKPYWLFQGDTSPQNPIWQTENYNIPLILNKWFKVEYYVKWSAGSDGYASMKVNGKLIGEHQGATTAKADPLDFIMLTQVYGNSHPMHQWVDDIEIWDGLPSE